MKELNSFDKLSEKATTELQVKKQVQVEYLFDGVVKPMPGHKIWEIELSTMKVKEAEFVKNMQITWHEALESVSGKENREIIDRKGCFYIAALNPENALKRFNEGKESAHMRLESKPLSIF